jgi:hypothetical protein
MLILSIIPFIISGVTGWLLLRCFTHKQKTAHCFLDGVMAGCLGIAVSVMLSFSSYLIFNHWVPIYVLCAHAALILVLITRRLFLNPCMFQNTRLRPVGSTTEWIFFGLLVIASIPLWYQVFFYAYGGWDAWSTWNLKAKFLFLGGTDWQNLFEPKLWRSSPHYPLFLPLTNVWSWVIQNNAAYQGPAFTAFLITWINGALLTFSLYYFTRSRAAILPALMLFSLPFFNKLALSQYADNVVALYLLLCAVLWVKAITEERPLDLGLCGFFLGIMSFIKNEGLLYAGWFAILICGFLILDKKIKQRTSFLVSFVIGGIIGSIPTLIFYLIYAPHNITFVNGLISAGKPSTIQRFQTILGFYSLEFFSPLWNVIALFHSDLEAGSFVCKWNGIWLLLTGGLFLAGRQCFRRPWWIFAIFIPAFMTVITAYYWINTYFESEWWLQVSLNRIISTFLPLWLFWVFLSIWRRPQKENPIGDACVTNGASTPKKSG